MQVGARDAHRDRQPGPLSHQVDLRAVAEWGQRVTAATVTAHDGHAGLDGVSEVLVHPDGHIAWATRATGTAERHAGRRTALTAWAGPPGHGFTRPVQAEPVRDQ
ncbi:aromatic-ring hydroxylase C-terminal domain-containing protein [Streptomyces apricus]|uniref:aromatic-ring hydroxylase C-terminal domain-containing protein n=1 Tax=Streptomyces apricus TaxID=1828112 RepID=UPI002E26689C